MNPIVDGLEKEYQDQIAFTWLNVDNPPSREVAIKYGVRFIPLLILVDEEGTPVDYWAGEVPQHIFEEAFDDLLPNQGSDS